MKRTTKQFKPVKCDGWNCRKFARFECLCGQKVCAECSEGGYFCPEDIQDHSLSPLPARGKTNPSKKVARGKKTKKQ